MSIAWAHSAAEAPLVFRLHKQSHILKTRLSGQPQFAVAWEGGWCSDTVEENNHMDVVRIPFPHITRIKSGHLTFAKSPSTLTVGVKDETEIKWSHKLTLRQGVKAPRDSAEHMRYKSTALNTNSTPSKTTANKQIQGCTPARKYTPGYANSQQKFREHVQAAMTPNNRIWARSGESPTTDLLNWLNQTPEKGRLITSSPEPFMLQTWHFTEGAESLTAKEGRETNYLFHVYF